MSHPPVPSHPSDLLLQPFMILISITIIIIINIITLIIAIIINSTKDDIWDLDLKQKRIKLEGLFTFYFLSTKIHKYSYKYCIVKEGKDGMSCIYPVYRLDWALLTLFILFSP